MKQITDSLVNFVAKDMCPIALVEVSYFIEFMSVVDLEPNYKIPSRKHIMEVTLIRWRIFNKSIMDISDRRFLKFVSHGLVSGNNCLFYK